jgi:hypothetical protein
VCSSDLSNKMRAEDVHLVPGFVQRIRLFDQAGVN